MNNSILNLHAGLSSRSTNGVLTPISNTSPPVNATLNNNSTVSPTFQNNYQQITNSNKNLNPNNDANTNLVTNCVNSINAEISNTALNHQNHGFQQVQHQIPYDTYYGTTYLSNYSNGFSQNPYRHYPAADYVSAAVVASDCLQNSYNLQRADIWPHKFPGF